MWSHGWELPAKESETEQVGRGDCTLSAVSAIGRSEGGDQGEMLIEMCWNGAGSLRILGASEVVLKAYLP